MPYPVRRLLAFQLDCACIVFWGVALFGLTLLWNDGEVPAASNPWRGQMVGLLTMTLPVILVFAWMEGQPRGATPGKRLQKLRTASAAGAPLGFRVALLRNALKFLPWECGHLVAHQAYHAEGSSFPLWLYVPGALSMMLPLWWLAGLFRSGYTPYDRATRSVVVPLPGSQPSS